MAAAPVTEKLSLDLCVPIETHKIGGHEVRSIGGGSLLVCLSTKIPQADVGPLALDSVKWQSLKPAGDTTIVFRDSAIADEVAKSNLTAILHQHGLETLRNLSAVMQPYVPDSLPLADLDYRMLLPLVGHANAALARYDGLLQGIPNPEVMLSPRHARTEDAGEFRLDQNWIEKHGCTTESRLKTPSMRGSMPPTRLQKPEHRSFLQCDQSDRCWGIQEPAHGTRLF